MCILNSLYLKAAKLSDIKERNPLIEPLASIGIYLVVDSSPFNNKYLNVIFLALRDCRILLAHF